MDFLVGLYMFFLGLHLTVMYIFIVHRTIYQIEIRIQ